MPTNTKEPPSNDADAQVVTHASYTSLENRIKAAQSTRLSLMKSLASSSSSSSSQQSKPAHSSNRAPRSRQKATEQSDEKEKKHENVQAEKEGWKGQENDHDHADEFSRSDFSVNKGVGYVPDDEKKKNNDSAKQQVSVRGNRKEDEILRGKLLGKRGRGQEDGKGKRWKKDESSEDEEGGRSGLGRAKKRK